MRYTLSYQKPHQHFVDIRFTVNNPGRDVTYLQLPSWRPGRYEIQNFAKNIQKFHVEDGNGNPLPFRKVTKDRWEVETKGVQKLEVIYNYYAVQMDAGGTYLDEEQLYVNFVNCLLFAEGHLEEECRIDLKLPGDYEVACGLRKEGKHTLIADSYYIMVDSPMIASNQLTHRTYEVAGTVFHLWVMGHCRLNWDKALQDFKGFTEAQVKAMGGFPIDNYHFLFQFLPYKAYHGVEHFNSTIITLGPDYEINDPEMYKNLLGISSHELYHAWNIIRIRPTEMMPYDFTKENYFTTGFVVEGVTTYMGDVFLARGGAFTPDDYLIELNKNLQRHLTNWGRFNHSLADSSWDMWLDGYSPGIPNRKVSIYIKGCLISLLLDLKIREVTNNEKSLDSVMQILNKEFAEQNRGYTYQNFIEVASGVAGKPLDKFFADYVTGKEPLEDVLDKQLKWAGLKLQSRETGNDCARLFGFKVTEKDNQTFVTDIAPFSPADELLVKNDELVALNGRKVTTNLPQLLNKQEEVTLTFFRNQKLQQAVLKSNGTTYFKDCKIVLDPEAGNNQLLNLKAWIGKVSFE